MLTNAAIAKNKLLDAKIEKTKQLFYQELERKKRNIRRQWLNINSIVNSHCLQTLPYRSMLKHVGDLTEERRLTFSQNNFTDHNVTNVEDPSDSSRVHICLEDDRNHSDEDDEYSSLPDSRRVGSSD